MVSVPSWKGSMVGNVAVAGSIRLIMVGSGCMSERRDKMMGQDDGQDEGQPESEVVLSRGQLSLVHEVVLYFVPGDSLYL